ncbi:MAG: hypothetical protein BWY92_01314 [Firmicutes bacterium ADurb.BinA052]|nr:MAG: hypothetical protein BWY92_01314 [Firmicutes bacterium ADurb.BinA052]
MMRLHRETAVEPLCCFPLLSYSRNVKSSAPSKCTNRCIIGERVPEKAVTKWNPASDNAIAVAAMAGNDLSPDLPDGSIIRPSQRLLTRLQRVRHFHALRLEELHSSRMERDGYSV